MWSCDSPPPPPPPPPLNHFLWVLPLSLTTSLLTVYPSLPHLFPFYLHLPPLPPPPFPSPTIPCGTRYEVDGCMWSSITLAFCTGGSVLLSCLHAAAALRPPVLAPPMAPPPMTGALGWGTLTPNYIARDQYCTIPSHVTHAHKHTDMDTHMDMYD